MLFRSLQDSLLGGKIIIEAPFSHICRTGDLIDRDIPYVFCFQQRLERQGITATVRRSLGGDIDASCGQLRRKAMEQEREEREQ